LRQTRHQDPPWDDFSKLFLRGKQILREKKSIPGVDFFKLNFCEICVGKFESKIPKSYVTTGANFRSLM
jgi:hypothetical protein